MRLPAHRQHLRSLLSCTIAPFTAQAVNSEFTRRFVRPQIPPPPIILTPALPALQLAAVFVFVCDEFVCNGRGEFASGQRDRFTGPALMSEDEQDVCKVGRGVLPRFVFRE
jgi:hypothetical protein